MEWKIKNGVVEDEHGEMVCILSEDASPHHIALIKNASEMFDAIKDYLQSFERTTQPTSPKKHRDNFQKIFERINDET
jgi:hypothetical protein